MAQFNVPTDAVQSGVLYRVAGEQTATYNSVAYATGSTFRGVVGFTSFTYSGSGTQIVNQVTEFASASLEYVGNSTDLPTFPESTILKGFAIEFAQQGDDIHVEETTIIKGFAIEFVDTNNYVFQILTRRL
jgi:hypothetical protein